MGLWGKLKRDLLSQDSEYYKTAEKLQNLSDGVGTTAGFYKNFVDMANAPKLDNKDKYFHAKANFNAGQHFDFAPAITLSVLKEVCDVPYKTWINPNGLGFRTNFNDSIEDLEADFYGLAQGALNPKGKPQIYLKKYRPIDLDEKY